MPVPDYQSLTRPTLAAMTDGGAHRAKDLRTKLASDLSLGPEKLAETIPSKYARLFHNRLGWAITYLYRAKLIDRPKHATYTITERGRNVLDDIAVDAESL